MDELLERLDAAIMDSRASISAIEELSRAQELRLTRMEGDVAYVKGVAKGLVQRLTALEVLQTGTEEGSFAWALVMLRYGNAMRRRRWGDASRVEPFDWRHWLESAPDEDLLATDWQKAF